MVSRVSKTELRRSCRGSKKSAAILLETSIYICFDIPFRWFSLFPIPNRHPPTPVATKSTQASSVRWRLETFSPGRLCETKTFKPVLRFAVLRGRTDWSMALRFSTSPSSLSHSRPGCPLWLKTSNAAYESKKRAKPTNPEHKAWCLETPDEVGGGKKSDKTVKSWDQMLPIPGWANGRLR